MNKKFTHRHMEPTPSIEQHANAQLAKIEEFLKRESEPIHLELIFHDGRPHAHFKVEFLLKSPHYDLFVEKEGPHFYQVMDEVIDVMYAQLRKEKDRHLEDRKMTGRHDDFKKQR
jgi:ribosomal subunit interface protein